MIHPRLTVMSVYYVEYIVSFHLWGFVVSIAWNQSIEFSSAVVVVAITAAQTKYICVLFFSFSMVSPYVYF